MVFLVLLFAWLNGCKKKDTPADKEKQISSTRDIPDWVKEKFRKAPTKMIFPGDGKKYRGIVLDRNGEEITRERIASRQFSIPCDYLDPDFVDNTFQMKGETLSFGCDYILTGFQFVATLQFTTGFNIELIDPLNMSNHSRISCNIREVGTGNLLSALSDIDIAAGDIQNMGTVLGNPDLTIYHITYTSPIITSIASPADVYFEYRPYIYTDCGDAHVTTTWISNPYKDYDDPCKRIDVIDFIGDFGSPGWAYFNGSNAGTCYPSGFLPPEQHWIEWYKPGTSMYGTASSPTRLQFPNFCLPSATFIDLPSTLGTSAVLFPTTGIIKVRYRNRKQTSSDPCTSTNTCQGPLTDYYDLDLY